MRDFYIFRRFQFFLLFSIGCESKFREMFAYLEVWSSDFVMKLENDPLKGIGVRDIIMIFRRFQVRMAMS